MPTAAAGCTSLLAGWRASAIATQTSVLSSSSRRKTTSRSRSPTSLNSVTRSFTIYSPAQAKCKTYTHNSEILRRGRSEQHTETLVKIASDSRHTRSPDEWLRYSPSSNSIVTRRRPICSNSANSRTSPSSPSAHSLTARANSTAWRRAVREGAQERRPTLRPRPGDISLGRLGDPSAARAILPHAAAPRLAKRPKQNEPNPAAVIPHLATRALVALKPVDTLLAALDTEHRATALERAQVHSRRQSRGHTHQPGQGQARPRHLPPRSFDCTTARATTRRAGGAPGRTQAARTSTGTSGAAATGSSPV